MNFSGYAPPPPSLRGVRFILVDDQTEVAAALAASLTHYAQMVCVGVFAEGQRALAHLKREPVDLVLLDLLMPAMPGVRRWPGARCRTRVKQETRCQSGDGGW